MAKRRIITAFPPELTLDGLARMDLESLRKSRDVYILRSRDEDNAFSLDDILNRYPEYVRDELGNEAEDVEHLSKWLSLGGASDAVQRWMDERKPKYKKRTAEAAQKARKALLDLTKEIENNRWLCYRAEHSESNIPGLIAELYEFLSADEFSFDGPEDAQKPGQRNHVESLLAARVITKFFPPDYPVSQAARVFCKAWYEVLGGGRRRSESSIRVIMQNAKKAHGQHEDSEHVFDKWRAGKNCKD